jgi:16S rRNA (guanine527-N7)-methyltransferase
MTTGQSSALSIDTIRRSLGRFQVQVNDRQVTLIQQYMAILAHWNEKLNLTAIRDPLEILHRHFCESMFAVSAVSVNSGRLADIGTGAGFPGIPMKILRPELELFLVESSIKKGTFLAEVLRDLDLPNAKVLISRYEELGEELAPLDYVCARAVGDYGPFLKWAGSEHLSASRLVLWVGGRDLDEIQKSTEWDWQQPVSVPESLQRYLLVGTKKVGSPG